MIAILTADLFSQANTLPLLTIFQLGSEGRHIIWTHPVRDPADQASSAIGLWLQTLPLFLRESVAAVLDFGTESSIAAGTLRIVITADTERQISPGWPHVTLTDGLRLLQTPLAVVLENRRSDRAFLEGITLPAQRPSLKQAVASGWLCFESSGGIPELVKRLEDQVEQEKLPTQQRKEAALCHLRWWCLCDRDSSKPGGLSDQADRLETARKELKPELPYGPLRRRMSESYLPEKALELWADKPAKEDERRLRQTQLAAWKKLSPSLRERFELKQGFLWGLSGARKTQLMSSPKHTVTKAELLRALSPQTPAEKTLVTELHRDKAFLQALKSGLGNELSALFSDEKFQEAWLNGEVSHAERFDLIQSILSRL